jgi:hypothetical protein
MISRLTLAAIFAVLIAGFLSPKPAHATDTLKFCMKMAVGYVDSGQGSGYAQEDYWTETSSTNRYLRGARARVKKANTTVWGWDYLAYGDYSASPGNGCTTEFEVSSAWGWYSISIESRGRVRTIDLRVDSHPSGTVVTNAASVFVVSGGTYDVTIGAGSNADEWQVYLASAFGLWQSPGNVANDDITINVGDVQGNPVGSCNKTKYCSSEVWIDDNADHPDRKFVITHELGHAIGDRGTNGKLVNGDCGPWNWMETDCFSTGTHSMISKEVGKCGFAEGFGHFWAATVWNNTSETSCYFEYWSSNVNPPDNDPMVNCESGAGTFFDTKYLEGNCQGTWSKTVNGQNYSGTDWEGLANELDWFRAFWDMRTDNYGNCTTMPTLTAMMDWISATDWDPDSDRNSDEERLYTYEVLNDQANSTGGSLNSCFDQAKGVNGIDHPYSPGP